MSENIVQDLREDELDTIGEIMNISMGAGATALSTMLEKQVSITTPVIKQDIFNHIDSTGLEPAIMVKIQYVRGITGTNATMFRKNDMQIILDLLMGNDEPLPPEEFEFDDMSMSAACEVMNQMMGASSTALSEILEEVIDISPPKAELVMTKDDIDHNMFEIKDDESVVAVSFQLQIKDTLDTTFVCFLPLNLAKSIVDKVHSGMEEEVQPEPVAAQPEPVAPAPVAAPAPAQPEPVAQQAPPPVQVQPPVQPEQVLPQPTMPVMQTPPVQAAPNAEMPQMQNPYMQNPYMNPYMQNPYMQNPYMNPYMQAPQEQAEMPPVRSAEYPNFVHPTRSTMPSSNSNMNLLMGVQLEISVVIGRAKQKIKDIMELGQGTVLELDKQTGAPAEIMVNGQLLAYGDIIVVGDNFGIRVTEIVGSKELLESLTK